MKKKLSVSSLIFESNANLFVDQKGLNLLDLKEKIKTIPDLPKKLLDLEFENSIKDIVESLGGEDIIRKNYIVSPFQILTQIKKSNKTLLKNKHWNICFLIGKSGKLVIGFYRFLHISNKFALYFEDYNYCRGSRFNSGSRIFGKKYILK